MDITADGPLYDPADTFRLSRPRREMSERERSLQVMIKQRAGDLRDVIMTMPATRERAKALTELEDAVLWAVKAATA